MLIGWFFSMTVCYVYHKQSYLVSLFASRMVMYYLLYFFLHAFQFKKELVLNTILIVGFIALGLYFIQYVIYPVRILNTRMGLDRGTVRLFVPGLNAAIVIYFIYINRFFNKRRLMALFVALLCYSAFILQATRQVIFGIALLTVVNVFISKQIRSRGLIVLLMSVAVVSIFFVFQDLFTTMFELSESQSSEGETTRTRTIRFFTTEFQTDLITYIFGNGEGHPASQYGRRLDMYKLVYDRYLSDIGILGDYVRYGSVFVIAGVILLLKSVFIRVSSNVQNLKYYLLFLLLTIITSKGILGSADVVMIMIFYLIDIDIFEQKQIAQKQLVYE